MERMVMKRNAADNKYLHKDFHKTMDLGLIYLAHRYGNEAVKKYIRQVVNVYYAPLIDAIKREGLVALERNIEKSYEIEEAPELCQMRRTDNTLEVEVSASPVVAWFQENGYRQSPWFWETTNTFNEEIAAQTGLSYTMNFYEQDTGKCKYSFSINEVKK